MPSSGSQAVPFTNEAWYVLYTEPPNGGNNLGTSSTIGSAEGASTYSVVKTANSSDLCQRWQFFPRNEEHVYLMRNACLGPDIFLQAYWDNLSNSAWTTGVHMARASGGDATSWFMQPWGDGFFKIMNVANGSDWEMDIKENTTPFMTSNLTEGRIGQHWYYTSVASVTDQGFLTVSTRGR